MVIYKEALEKSLTARWKVEPCHQGESCWCRMIVPEEDIVWQSFHAGPDEEFYLVGSGSIGKEVAEHIVKIHNQSL